MPPASRTRTDLEDFVRIVLFLELSLPKEEMMSAIYAVIIGCLALECWRKDCMLMCYVALAWYVGSVLKFWIDGGIHVSS